MHLRFHLVIFVELIFLSNHCMITQVQWRILFDRILWWELFWRVLLFRILNVVGSNILIGRTILLYGRQYYLILLILGLQYVLLISPLCPLRPLLLQLIEQLIDLLALVVLLRLLLRLLRGGRLTLLRALLIEVLGYYDTDTPHSPRVETRLHEGLATALEHICVVIVRLPHVRVLLAFLLKGFRAARDEAGERLLSGVHSHMILKSIC
jgi:hypothetical protein